MLTSKEAFKAGFLARCAVAGLSIEESRAAVKEAQAALTQKSAFVGSIIDAIKGLGQTALGWGIPAALAAPPIVGGLAGYGLARATDISDTDVADIKDRELMDEYSRQTEKLKRQRAIRDYEKARQRTGRIFPR